MYYHAYNGIISEESGSNLLLVCGYHPSFEDVKKSTWDKFRPWVSDYNYVEWKDDGNNIFLFT